MNNTNYAYSVKADRIIYIIHAPNCKDFFIWHCKKDLWKASYKRHLHGQRKPTAEFMKKCAEKGYPLCFHILEEVHLTQVMAYRHVIAWSEFFYRNGYEPLTDGLTLYYMSEMHEYTQSVFDRIQNSAPTKLLSCETCLIENCSYKKSLN